jgi:TPR repeat protein
MFAALGLAAALAVTPAGTSALGQATQAVRPEDGGVSDFNAGLRAYHSGDLTEASLWFGLSAVQGNAAAQFTLGLMYANGQGVAQNHAEAVQWYRMAADQGRADAQYNLGLMYANGQGVPQNYAEAVRWYRVAADKGYAPAQKNLGIMYALGRGVPENIVEAYKWFNLAAVQGEATAVDARDKMQEFMTPAQIEEGQRLAAEWRPR